MKDQLLILLIDDDEDEYILVRELISGPARGRTILHIRLDWVSTYEEALEAFSDCRYDLFLVDYHLGGRTGLELLHEEAARTCAAPVIMLTGQGSYAIDLSAMELGVADYLEKNQLTLPLLERSIRYAIDRKRAELEFEALIQERDRDLALMKRQALELASLQKATSSLLHTLNISRLMGQILDAAREAIPAAELVRLHILEHQHGRGKVLGELPLNDSRVHRIDLSGDLPAPLKDIGSGYSLLIPDLQTVPDLLVLLQNEQERHAARSAMIAPMILDREVLGTLSLTASVPSVFSEADLGLLTAFAATATAAVHNAILYHETQNLAATDPLTGQLNRRTFFELGQREIDRFKRFGHAFSWIMFDVDLFKQINDKYGHPAGDQVLTTIVDRCCDVIRHVDILGRYGGDEFVILLPETDHERAKEIAERIRASISDSPVPTNAGPIHVSISVGITEVTSGNADLGFLLNKVDRALYLSKQAGRNTTTVLI
ncbi:MAG: diguanylate cyclase [Bacteroidota bacterium]